MNNLEILLLAIIWIAYGLFAAYQSECTYKWDKEALYILYPIFEPIVFILKAIYGAFKQYK